SWLLLIVAMGFSGVFSAMERAYIHVNWLRIKNIGLAGKEKGKKVYALAEKENVVLTTVLVGDALSNVIASASAILLASRRFSLVGTFLTMVVFFFVLMVFCEALPKSFAKERAEKVILGTYGILATFMILFFPISKFIMFIQEKFEKKIRPETVTVEIEDELMTIVSEAQSEGDMNEQEGELIRSAIEFRDLDVQDILTPRVDIVGISIESTMEETMEVFIENEYTRLPVYRGSMDKIVGILHQKDFFMAMHKGIKNIKSVIQPVVFAPETLKISKLLHLLQSNKTHIAVVVDEFGGTEGIVTMEDILEELVGEIYDEHDDIEVDIQCIQEGEYLINGGTDLEEVLELFHLEDTYETDTVAGWVAEEMEKIPTVGERFSVGPVEVIITQADRKRVTQVKIIHHNPPQETDGKEEQE
ncbi:MAG: HlyC/CorC family transporter, partial [Clostridiales bacterium]|nr:HlyC/CorC family transporter [Clostridiales bacterium]